MNHFASRLTGVLLMFAFVSFSQAQSGSGYKLTQTFPIGGGGGWDYLAVDQQKLYVSHATQVNILNVATGDSVGVITGTTGVHGIAFVPSLKKGFVSNGKLNSVTVFSLDDDHKLGEIAVGQNPDAIFYDPFSRMIITCNGRSNNLSVVDPVTLKLVQTIPVSGKPETAVSDEAGKIFVNIEDKNQIDVVDIKAAKKIKSFALAGAEGPTGLVIDLTTHHLFAGCEKRLVGLNYVTGKVTSSLAIADGCDGLAFDPSSHYIFASCGEGQLFIAEEKTDGAAAVVDSIASKRSARTIAIDPATHKVYLPAAEFGKETPGQRPPVMPGTFQVLVFAKN